MQRWLSRWIPGSGGRGDRRTARIAARRHRSRGHPIADAFAQWPNLGWAVLIGMTMVLVVTSLGLWTRSHPLVAVGRIMDQTRTVRIGFRVQDETATQERRQEVRLRTPRVYNADTALLNEIETSLASLPKTLASTERLDDVAEEIRRQFRLTDETLAAVRTQVQDGRVVPEWRDAVRRLSQDLLRTVPMLEAQTWQRATQKGGHSEILLRIGDEERRVARGEVLNVDAGEAFVREIEAAVRRAGFKGPLATVVVNRLTTNPRPTFRYDATATRAAQDAAAAAVAPRIDDNPAGMTIFERGDRLSSAVFNRYKAEMKQFRHSAGAAMLWPPRLGLLGAVSALTLAIGLYVRRFCPRIAGNVSRMGWLAGLMLAALALACWAMVLAPGSRAIVAVAPTVFVAAILSIAYDQRSALALAAMQGLLVGLCVDLPISGYVAIIVGVGAVVWRLREVRDRNTLVWMGLSATGALASVTFAGALLDLPMVPGAVRQALMDAFLAGLGGLMVGTVTLFVLRPIERAFDITTGMTLIELADTRQPLLRQLQQRAPGTYNHSLNVASIAEAAADAIGADSLLTYTGALYHDIGKMNKPEYFVENQSGGPNKHDKLSPAMSLMVIVGHVKDGLELARESALPRTLHHFIEAHHGTTLVEYFYQRARDQAKEHAAGERDEGSVPEEFDYRYPGPKPRTKEVAIVMLADAVESATRSMSEPTPSRIDALVRQLATKRLNDGQFDDCELTLRDVQTIVESISKTVASIYHGRIAYPGKERQERRA